MTNICKCGHEEKIHYKAFPGHCWTLDCTCKKFEVDCEEPIDLCPNCKPKNHNEYVREWNKKNPDKVRKIVKKYRGKNQEKQPAWDKARRGIGAIKIEGLCQICKIEKAKLRHHKDYSKPREVILICAKCHKNIHTNSQQSKVGQSGMPKRSLGALTAAGTNPDSPHDFNLKEEREKLFKKYFKKSNDVELTEMLEDIEHLIEQQDKEFIKRRDSLDRLYMLGEITRQEHADRCEKLAGYDLK